MPVVNRAKVHKAQNEVKSLYSSDDHYPQALYMCIQHQNGGVGHFINFAV